MALIGGNSSGSPNVSLEKKFLVKPQIYLEETQVCLEEKEPMPMIGTFDNHFDIADRDNPKPCGEIYKEISEKKMCGIFANRLGSANKSKICREATVDEEYFVDIMEERPDGRLFLYEFKKVLNKQRLRPALYSAFGQSVFYSSFLKKEEYKIRILLITHFHYFFHLELRMNRFFSHFEKEFNVDVKMLYCKDVLSLEKQPTYAVIPDDLELPKKYLRPLRKIYKPRL